MATIAGLKALRKAVERQTGKLPNDVWREVQPPPYPDEFDEKDVTDLVHVVRSSDTYADIWRVRFRQVCDKIGIANPQQLLAHALVELPSLMTLPALSTDSRAQDPGPGLLFGEEDLVQFGQLLVMLVCARVAAEGTPLGRRLAMDLAFNQRRQSAWQKAMAADPIGYLAAFVRKHGSQSLSRAWQLRDADNAVRDELMAEMIEAFWNDPAAVTRRLKGASSVTPTWEARWQRYQAGHASSLGRSFPSVDAYRKAVSRSRAEMDKVLIRSADWTRGGQG